jgi:hypothetical protein
MQTNEHPELTTGVYIDTQGRKWFCIRRDDDMSCSSSGSLHTLTYVKEFKAWGWKLTKDQTY